MSCRVSNTSHRTDNILHQTSNTPRRANNTPRSAGKARSSAGKAESSAGKIEIRQEWQASEIKKPSSHQNQGIFLCQEATLSRQRAASYDGGAAVHLPNTALSSTKCGQTKFARLLMAGNKALNDGHLGIKRNPQGIFSSTRRQQTIDDKASDDGIRTVFN